MSDKKERNTIRDNLRSIKGKLKSREPLTIDESIIRHISDSDYYRTNIRNTAYSGSPNYSNFFGASKELYTAFEETKDSNLSKEVKDKYLSSILKRAKDLKDKTTKYFRRDFNQTTLNQMGASNMLAEELIRQIEDKPGGRDGGLEKAASSVVGLMGIVGGLFFLSSNITGNVIANLNKSSSSTIGIVFLIMGLIGAFLFFKNK